jgi:hypothetical protein
VLIKCEKRKDIGDQRAYMYSSSSTFLLLPAPPPPPLLLLPLSFLFSSLGILHNMLLVSAKPT